MQDQITQLIHDAESGNFSRRSLLKRAAALGLSFPAAVALFALAGPISDLYNTPDLAWPLRGVAIALFGQSIVLFIRSIFVALRRGLKVER